jgi:hypothetical protein
LSIRQDGLQASHTSGGSAHGNRSGRPRNSANTVNNSERMTFSASILLAS